MNNFHAKVAERLRAARAAASLTQFTVAQKLQISQQTIANWERQRAEPSLKNLTQLATLYEVSLDWLLFGEAIPHRFRSHAEILSHVLDPDPFTTHELEGILAGCRIQIRRPIGFAWPDDPCPYGQSGDVIWRHDNINIRLREVRIERLHDITEEGAFAELGDANTVRGTTWSIDTIHGIKLKESFREMWETRYGKTKMQYTNNPYVWVMTVALEKQ